VSKTGAIKSKHVAAAKKPATPGLGNPRFLEDTRVGCALIFAAVFLVFWPVHRFDYVNYDDSDYVSANPHVQSGLTLENLRWAFTTGHASNWHPLTWISHMLDLQLFGNNPGAQHLVSVAIHALNAALLLVLLRRMTGFYWRSFLVAAFFALHPLRAESVAWISERKDVLSAFFLFLCLGAYWRYSKATQAEIGAPAKRWTWYGAALALFALGLMSKPMLVTVPFQLLLLDYWPLRKLTLTGSKTAWPLLIGEKIPFLLLAIISSAITFLVQQKGGAVSTVLPLSARLANALISYVRYIAKTFWPVDLSVLYPHPGHWPAWQVLASGLLLLLISALVIWQLKKRPYLPVGWFWFVGGLVPVIGLVQVGIQSMADRYTYIPGIGLSLMVVWLVAEWVNRVASLKYAGALSGVAAVACCAVFCANQILYWRDSETLFHRAIEVTRDNYLAYNNLGFYLANRGKPEEAKEYYRQSIAINPNYSDALNNLGFVLAGERKHAEAISYYERALRSSPNQPEIHNNYGNALSELGNLDAAIAQYELVLRLKPDHADAHNNLGIALAMRGKLDPAIVQFKEALRSKPNYASAHSNLGNALAAQHKLAEAATEYQECLRLNPNDPQAYNNLGNVLLQQGLLDQAIKQYSEALRRNPDNPEAHFNIAIAFARGNQRAQAVQHFQETLRLNPGNAEAKRQLDALASGH
jgi:protein O-mannosyl-transferase